MNSTINGRELVSETTVTAHGSSVRAATEPFPESASEPLLTVYAPSRSWGGLDLHKLWAYRELLYFLTWRDLKVRYKQTALGVGWVVMQPLLMTIIYTVFLGKLARVPSDNIPYPLFAYAGLLPWTFFSTTITNTGNSLVSSAHLITKVYFPRIIIPIAAVGARLVDFLIAFVILVGLMVYYRVAPTWNILMLPALMALVTAAALAVGLFTSALNVKYRDVTYILPVLVQLWMFVSPVLYPASLVPERFRWLYSLNPLAGIIEGFRSALLNRDFDWSSLAISTGFTLALLVFSAYVFRRVERSFADII